MELKEAVFSGDVQSIVLLGPKGYGKTIATITLFLSLMESGRTALYIITPVILQNLGLENMMQYTRTLVEQYQKCAPEHEVNLTAIVESEKNFIGFFMKYINTFCKHRIVYLLIDFCKLPSFRTETIKYLTSLASMMNKNLIKIVAVSSGEGQDINLPHLRDTIRDMISDSEKAISMKGFNEIQALEYIKIKNRGKKVNYKSIKPYCGYNPLLLSRWSDRYINNIPEYQLGIRRIVKNFI